MVVLQVLRMHVGGGLALAPLRPGSMSFRGRQWKKWNCLLRFCQSSVELLHSELLHRLLTRWPWVRKHSGDNSRLLRCVPPNHALEQGASW
jgi:hypothetical protein